MTDALATIPATKKQTSSETKTWSLTVTPSLALGETPSLPVSKLTDLATNTLYATGLSGAPSLVGNVITQTTLNLVAGHTYRLEFIFTASAGNVLGPALLIECPW